MTEVKGDSLEMSTEAGDKEKQPRQRKKLILQQLREQMEFYFSSPNLTKDKFMIQLMKTDPFIDLKIFLSFRRIRSLTDDVGLIKKAVKKSSLIVLSDDGTKVKRAFPIEQKHNETDCTIYIENLPPSANHDWVNQVFSEFGQIDHISMPRFRQTRQFKGFAFVEFQSVESAQQALAAFGSIDDQYPQIEPENLLCVQTYEGSKHGALPAVSEHNKKEDRSLVPVSVSHSKRKWIDDNDNTNAEVPDVPEHHVAKRAKENAGNEIASDEHEVSFHVKSKRAKVSVGGAATSHAQDISTLIESQRAQCTSGDATEVVAENTDGSMPNVAKTEYSNIPEGKEDQLHDTSEEKRHCGIASRKGQRTASLPDSPDSCSGSRKRSLSENELSVHRESDDKKSLKRRKEDLLEAETSQSQKEASDAMLTELGQDSLKKKKKKRRRNKKERDFEIDHTIHMRVMSKRQWKYLRNKYLNTQRNNMKTLKGMLQHYNGQHLHVSRNDEKWGSKTSFCDKNLRGGTPMTEHSSDVPQFVPGAVVKIRLASPPQNPRKLRESIREVGGPAVRYVETSSKENCVYVRFTCAVAASRYLETGVWKDMKLISEKEETDYWKHIASSWKEKRGRQKKLYSSDMEESVASASGKSKKKTQKADPVHIIFDD